MIITFSDLREKYEREEVNMLGYRIGSKRCIREEKVRLTRDKHKVKSMWGYLAGSVRGEYNS